jgi:hypothetical protein
LNIALAHRDRIDPAIIAPRVNWRAASNDLGRDEVPPARAALSIVPDAVEVRRVNDPTVA